MSRGLVFGLLVGFACASPNCYRAELDLSLAGSRSAQGGDGGEAGTSGAGGSVPVCDDSPLEEAQRACQRGALPSLADCTEQELEGWSGCSAGGCTVCTKSVREYPYYFKWHPCCLPNEGCGSSTPVKCNARCPAPSERDRRRPCFVTES